jgi:hypothetical protein
MEKKSIVEDILKKKIAEAFSEEEVIDDVKNTSTINPNSKNIQ